jgi:hypothetical protein
MYLIDEERQDSVNRGFRMNQSTSARVARLSEDMDTEQAFILKFIHYQRATDGGEHERVKIRMVFDDGCDARGSAHQRLDDSCPVQH